MIVGYMVLFLYLQENDNLIYIKDYIPRIYYLLILFFYSKVLNTNGTTNLGENSVDSLDPSRRPWYMKGGSRRPYPAIRARNTGRRLAQLWPEENSYDDRVTNQVINIISYTVYNFFNNFM